MMKLKKGAVCPQCEKGKLIEARKDLEFKYKGKSFLFPQELVFSCSVCDYEALTREANSRIEGKLTDFRRVTENLLTSDEMISVRRRLGFNKKEMAALLSVNEKTIGRYESGKITQSEQVDKLYRIFRASPTMAKRFRVEKYAFEYESVLQLDHRQVVIYDVYPSGGYTYGGEMSRPREEWDKEYAEAA